MCRIEKWASFFENATNKWKHPIMLRDFAFVRFDVLNPAKSQGGGVLVYVKSGSPYSIISSQPNSTDEQIWIDVARPHCKHMIIGSVYRPPDLNISVFVQCLRTSLNKIYSDGCEIVILGTGH